MGNIELASFIVSVLGVLTTVLIGWNVYVLFDFDRKRKKFKELKSQMEQALKSALEFSNAIKASTEESISNNYLVMMSQIGRNELTIGYLEHAITAINHFSLCGNVGKYNCMIHDLKSFLDKNKEGLTLSQHDKKSILHLLDSIQGCSNYQELRYIYHAIEEIPQSKRRTALKSWPCTAFLIDPATRTR